VKFILNTAIDPHFCALFDEANNLVERKTWENRKMDGKEMFDFLTKQTASITFCGGVTGPGGFSSLRAGGGVLNALSVANNIPVHQVRADVWVREIIGSEDFLLNSFSDGVFYLENGKLVRITIDEASEQFEQPMFVGLLPPEKQEKMARTVEHAFENSEQVLLEVLEKSEPQEQFHADYEFPPV
jgi:hypothetical protein